MHSSIPGREAQRREPRIAPATHAPGRATKGPIVSGISSDAWRRIRHNGHLLLNLLDHLAGSDDATVIEIEYEELMSIADRMPQLKSSDVCRILYKLRERRVLSFDYLLSDERCTLLVSPWKFREQLAHRMSEEITLRRLARKQHIAEKESAAA